MLNMRLLFKKLVHQNERLADLDPVAWIEEDIVSPFVDLSLLCWFRVLLLCQPKMKFFVISPVSVVPSKERREGVQKVVDDSEQRRIF